MLSTKFIAKQGGGSKPKVSNSSGGIGNSGLPSSRPGKLNVDGGIKSRHAGPSGAGKPAVGSLSQQVAKVAANIPAVGQVTDSGGQFRIGKGSAAISRSGGSGTKGGLANLGKFGWPGSTKGLKGDQDLG